jgi:regulator of nonsense transcripts 1
MVSPGMFVRRLSALEWLKGDKCAPRLKNIILGHVPQRHRAVEAMKDASYEFGDVVFTATPIQTRVLSQAINSDLGLIQGPPGCGKTSVIAACVVHLLRQPDARRIRVCGTSNVSVENIVKSLLPIATLAGKTLVWLTAFSRDVPPSQSGPAYLSALCFQHIFRRETQEAKKFVHLYNACASQAWSYSKVKQMRVLRDSLERQICAEAHVVCCTLESSKRNCLDELRFPIVFLDEATQALEPSSLIPLTHEALKFILVGDQQQLGPVVGDRVLMRHGYDRSLFERLIQRGIEYDMLSE